MYWTTEDTPEQVEQQTETKPKWKRDQQSVQWSSSSQRAGRQSKNAEAAVSLAVAVQKRKAANDSESEGNQFVKIRKTDFARVMKAMKSAHDSLQQASKICSHASMTFDAQSKAVSECRECLEGLLLDQA